MNPHSKSLFSGLKILACGLGLGLSAMPAAADTLIFTGGSINNGANWNLDPGPGTQKPTTGDTGTISVDGVIGATNINFGSAVITQTAGTISTNADNNNLNYIGGGSVYNLMGGRLETRGVLANNSTVNLLGGVVQLGSTPSDSVGFGANGAAGVMNIGGTVEITGLKSYDIRTDSAATLNVLPDWLGTWSHPGFPAEGTWEDALVSINALFNGAEVTAANFSSIFSVTNGGQTISLVNALSAPTVAITEVAYSAATNEVTLTWTSNPDDVYIVRFSTDMVDWTDDIGDDLTMADDDDPTDGNQLTETFTLADFGISDLPKLFFRIEIE